MRRWDLAAVLKAFQVASGRAATLQKFGDDLGQVGQQVADWQGEAGAAFHAELGKTRTDIMSDGRESSHVAAALTASTLPPKPIPPAAAFSTAVPTGVDSACAPAKFDAEQFTGEWTESGDTTVTTLSVEGALKSGSGNQSGTWSYAPWSSTPGKGSMPHDEDKQCSVAALAFPLTCNGFGLRPAEGD